MSVVDVAILLEIFVSAVLPIIAVVVVGFILGEVKTIDPGPLGTVTVYVLAPALVFHTLVVTDLPLGDILRVGVGVLAFTLVMVVGSDLVGRTAGRREPVLGSIVLVAAFPNAGNLGIPISNIAFGSVGRQTAVLFFSVQLLLMYTVGTYLAARSGGNSGLAGVKKVFAIPLIYVVVAAGVLRAVGLNPPANADAVQTIGLVGNSAIPIMLLLLGIQLARTDYGAVLSRTGLCTGLRLLAAPIVGLAIGHGLGFEMVTVARVFVLETAMATAVTPLILVMEFAPDSSRGGITGGHPALVDFSAGDVRFLAPTPGDVYRRELHLSASVEIGVCNNALSGAAIDAEALPEFVEILSSGVGELTRRQSDGFAYIRLLG